jgi:xylan 1,4-beta-xylosidase
MSNLFQCATSFLSRSKICFFAIAACILLAEGPAVRGETARVVEADFLDVKGTNSHFEAMCVGSGHASLLLRQTVLEQLADVSENCGFKYLRFHGLLCDDMGVYQAVGGHTNYNFQYVDLVYDSLLRIGVKPIVEISFMPSALACGTNTVFWWRANVTPPRNFEEWSKLVRALVEHLVQRYGRDEVKTWYFEVWNEPNHPAFYTTKIADYYALYDATVSAVKAVDASFRVGGPATAANGWVPELIAHCHKNGVPLDFISTHTYGVRGALDESGTKVLYLVSGSNVIGGGVRQVHDQIKKSVMPKLTLLYTEWSASYSCRDPVHDSYISAAYIVNTIKHCKGLTDAMSYWTFSDVFEELGPPPSPFHGGFGLINVQGLHKPAFYAYQFLHQLGDEELKTAAPDAIVCRSTNGVQVLVWNYTSPHQDEPDKNYFAQDLPAGSVPPVCLKLNHLPAGKYQLKVFGVGHRLNDVYADYLDMGSPQNLSLAQVAQLKNKNDGHPVLAQVVEVDSGGSFQWNLPMRENDVFLVTLNPGQ